VFHSFKIVEGKAGGRMNGEEKIPIFPLNVVMIPYGLMPLHIFEERYKKMINECLNEDKVFGMVYLEDKHLHKTGCTARVEKVIKRYDDGRMDILVSGQNRFKILDISEEEIYLQSNVLYMEDGLATDTPELTELARNGIHLLQKFERIMEISEGLDRLKNLDFTVVSYFLAGSHGLTLAEKQELLEIENAEERLVRGVDLLKSALDRAKLLKQIQTVRTDTLMMHGFSKN